MSFVVLVVKIGELDVLVLELFANLILYMLLIVSLFWEGEVEIYWDLEWFVYFFYC